MYRLTLFLFFVSAACFVTACGGTTVKVKQSSDGVNATVSVQTNNPTNVDVTPSVSVKLDDLTELLNVAQDTLSFDSNGEMTIGPDVIRKIVKSYK